MSHSHYIPPATLGSYPVRSGNKVVPLIDGHPAFSRICEAVECAKESLWVTVAFLDIDVQMPGNRGTFFNVLEQAAVRGVDVRVLFWRLPEWDQDNHLHRTGSQGEWFDAQDFSFKAKWDWLPKMYCHHQKSWLVDGASSNPIAFIGGINLDHGSTCAMPGHSEPDIHDVYVEVIGPATGDVAHNFVQRWNGASESAKENGVWPNLASADDLSYPTTQPPKAGDTPVQMGRTIRRGQGYAAVPALGTDAHQVEEGEHSILEQYVNAINAARRTIYIEDQSLASESVIRPLLNAMDRGVEVVAVVPSSPSEISLALRETRPDGSLFEIFDPLEDHDSFSFVGLHATAQNGDSHNVYVHAKIMLVDDEWTTIGSCNIADRSFYGDTELNATFWDAGITRKLRCELMQEHTGDNLEHLSDLEALLHFKQVAKTNREFKDRGEPMKSLPFIMSTRTYGIV